MSGREKGLLRYCGVWLRGEQLRVECSDVVRHVCAVKVWNRSGSETAGGASFLCTLCGARNGLNVAQR